MTGITPPPDALLIPNVIHRLPGRLRLGVGAIRWIPELQDRILRQVGDLPGVSEVRVSLITSNLLMRYDAQKLDEEALIEEVGGVFQGLRAYVRRARRERVTPAGVQERKIQEESLARKALDVVITGATLGFVWLTRKAPAAPLGFWSRFTSLPALTALALAAPLLRNGLSSLFADRRPNADTLSATAILSALATGRDTSALMIIWLADIAELLTGYTMERTRKAISKLLDIGDDHVWRLTEGGVEVKVPVEQIQAGDRIMAHTGEKICVDGVVESGSAMVDQASITGEFLPLEKEPGDPVFAGTVVKGGTLVVRAERVGDATAAARIIHLVEEAAQKRAPIQMFADKFSAQFIPVNFLLAGVVWAVTRDWSRALNMLIIDYSCGVRLSTATALAATISTAARQGVLVKGGQYIELLSSADTLVLDKTGTLTAGRPVVAGVEVLGEGLDADGLVALAAAVEQGAQHPLGQAVLDNAEARRLEIPTHGPPETVVGRGCKAKVGRAWVRVGSARFMEEEGVDLGRSEQAAENMLQHGRTRRDGLDGSLRR